jgi:hypothetical protein
VSVKLVSHTTKLSTWNVVGSATYADAGIYHVTVTVVDTDGSYLVTNNTSFKVTDVPLTDTTRPSIKLTLSGQSTGTVVLATFTDANPYANASDFAGTTVNWGGTVNTSAFSVQLVRRTATAFYWQVVGSATYSNTGLYAVTVTVNDIGGSTTNNRLPGLSKTWFLVLP